MWSLSLILLEILLGDDRSKQFSLVLHEKVDALGTYFASPFALRISSFIFVYLALILDSLSPPSHVLISLFHPIEVDSPFLCFLFIFFFAGIFLFLFIPMFRYTNPESTS